jgi:uncharacterized protein YwqG
MQSGRNDELLSDAARAFGRRLEAVGLGRYAAQLQQLIRPAVRLRPAVMNDETAGLCQSRLGGQPDLPPSEAWPGYRRVPQSFIAQVNLAEVRPHDHGERLPPAGLLSFFYDSEQSVWGFDLADNEAWAVIYTESLEALVRRAFPDALHERGRFRAMRLWPEQVVTYPPLDSSDVAMLGMSSEEQEAYADLVEEEDESPVHQFLGNPQPIQEDMQLECQLVSHGLNCGSPAGYNDPRAVDLRRGAVDWRLLLQIDSDDDVGMMWGDVGRIYYWMHRDSVRHRDWDKARLVLQCS